MTVGYHAPLPPAPSGVADYAAALAAALARHVRIDLNPARDCDQELYHLGNNRLHAAIYRRALTRPGVAVLHDAVLHHFLLGTMSREQYIEEFVYNYGEWTRDLAAGLWERRACSSQDPRFFRYPLLRRVAAGSRAIIVHNPAASRMVREHAPDTPVFEIPHLYAATDPPGPAAVRRLRARWGVRPAAAVFGVFGYLRETKRLSRILRAFRIVRREAPEARLLVAGRFASADLERFLADAWREPWVIRAGYLSRPDFALHAAAVDVCVNLRYPGAGETSGIAIQTMGIGKPTIVTQGEENAGFPETACIRVDAGPAEETTLAAVMCWLARDRDARIEIGRRAAAHIREHHAPAFCASLYARVLCPTAGAAA